MKKFVAMFLAILMLISATALADVSYSIKLGRNASVTLCESRVTIAPNGKTELHANVVNLVGYSTKWTSSNSKVVTVDKNGKLTGKSCGEATVTLTVTKTFTCKCAVYVTTGNLYLSSTNLNFNLAASKTPYQLKPTLYGTTLKPTTVKYESSNSSVATVSSSGIVTPKGVGRCVITCTNTANGKNTKVNVNVTESKRLSLITREQSNAYCCSGAASYNVIKFINGCGPCKTDKQLADSMSSSHYVYEVTNTINRYSKVKYKYVSSTNQKTWFSYVKASINAGCPVVALVAYGSSDKKITKYTTKGHYVVISGYTTDVNGNTTLEITDTYKISSNGGFYSMSLSSFFNASKNRGGWLIVKK